MKKITLIYACALLFGASAQASFLGTMQFSKTEFMGCSKDPNSPSCRSIVRIGCQAFCSEEERQDPNINETCKQLCPDIREQEHIKVAQSSEQTVDHM